MTATKREGWVVVSTRNPAQRLFLGEGGTWWSDLEQSRVFPTEREALIAKRGSGKVATGVEPYETALAREGNRTGQ